MAEIVSVAEAVEELVHDGDVVALEGFTHLIPHAAGHELIRQRRRDLTLVRMTPDVVYDQLIGMGCARKLVFSWGGNPGVGSLHRLRDAVEHGWPEPLELEEHSHAGMAAAYAAGAANLPFGVAARLRGHRPRGAHERRLDRVPVHRRGARRGAARSGPDVGIVHAQQADRRGNVQLWGIIGVQKEVVLASSRVDRDGRGDRRRARAAPGRRRPAGLGRRRGGAWRPAAPTPRTRTATTTATTTSTSRWDEISRDRDRFRAWMDAARARHGRRRRYDARSQQATYTPTR